MITILQGKEMAAMDSNGERQVACSRLLERCAKESARGRKRRGNGALSFAHLSRSLEQAKRQGFVVIRRVLV